MQNGERDNKRRTYWLRAAGLMLVLLLIVPGWRDVLATQLRAQIGQSPGALDPAEQTLRIAAQARQHPDDWNTQFAAAMNAATYQTTAIHPPTVAMSRRTLDCLLALRPKFGDQPALHAAITREMCMGYVRLNRQEADTVDGGSVFAQSPPRGADPKPADVQAFLQAAEDGQRIDPTNALFPLMRSIGLFQQHHDAEALTAFREAAACPRIDDYTSDEVDARWRMVQTITGTHTALPRLTVMASILLPHYAQVRALARMVLAKAVANEQAGRIGDGIALREDIAHVGQRLRSSSRIIIGSVVGIAITSISRLRPGGIPADKLPSNLSNVERERWQSAHLDAYCDFLTQNGRADLVDWNRSEFAAERAAHNAFGAGMERGITSPSSCTTMVVAWAASLVLLSVLVCVLILAAAAKLASRVTLNRLAPAGIARRRWLIVSRMAYVVSLVGLLVWWQEGAFARILTPLHLLMEVSQTLSNLTGDVRYGSQIDIVWLLGLCAGVIVGTFVLRAGWQKRGAGVRRMPLSTAMGQGIRRVWLPWACGLFVLYAVAVIGTARVEATMHQGLDAMEVHEGRYYSRCAGVAWPN